MRQKNMGSAGAIKIAVFPRYFNHNGKFRNPTGIPGLYIPQSRLKNWP